MKNWHVMPGGEDDPSDVDEETVLSPDELNIEDDESVVELEEGRYVISPEGNAPEATPESAPDDSDAKNDTESAQEIFDQEPVSADRVREWLNAHVSGSNCQYGFDITAKFEGSVNHHELFSNDVVATFETLLGWYAKHVGGDTPVNEVIGILLMESNVPVEYPPETIRAWLDSHGLSDDDSIADLVEAVGEEDVVRFPAAEGRSSE